MEAKDLNVFFPENKEVDFEKPLLRYNLTRNLAVKLDKGYKDLEGVLVSGLFFLEEKLNNIAPEKLAWIGIGVTKEVKDCERWKELAKSKSVPKSRFMMIFRDDKLTTLV